MKRTLVGILVMALLVGTGFYPLTEAQASDLLPAPKGLKVTSTTVGTDLIVTWEKVSGAEGYIIYMSTGEKDIYKPGDTRSGIYSNDIFYQAIGNVTDTSYTASELSKDHTYYFMVSSYNTVDGELAEGNTTVSVSCKTNKYPFYQVIDEGGQEVYFYWLWDGTTTIQDNNYNNAWNDCMSILEERSANETGEYPYGSSKTYSTGSYIDGKEVLRSTPHVAKGAKTAPKTDNEGNPKVGTATISVKNTEVGSDLNVTWKKVSGANGYDVYMSTSKNGTYKKVGTTPTQSYTTNDLKKDKTYYFKVKAYTIASINNKVNPDNKNVTVEVKKAYGGSSKAAGCKTSKYSLYTVIDKGGDNVYFYWLWDGKTAYKSESYWKCHNKCISIIKSRHKGKKNKGYGAGAKEFNYYIDGKQVVRALPCVFY